MTDEHQLIREVDRANLAKQIVDNPVWSDAWETCRQNLLGHIEHSELSDTAILEARHRLRAMNVIRAEIEEVMETGKLAARSLEELRDGRRTAA